MLEPLPFWIRSPRRDGVRSLGFEHVKAEIDGMLHLADDVLVFEWQAREEVQRFGLDGIGTTHEVYPPEAIEVPAEWISEVRVRSIWAVTWIRFRARRLDAFDGIPVARAGALTIRVGFANFRRVAPMVAAIARLKDARPYTPPGSTRILPPTETTG